MSKSLPQPWLRTTALELLSINGKNFPNHRPRAVQVIRTNEQLEFIVINDKENYVIVFLTAECVKDLREQQGIVRLTDLKNSVIKLENFHFSSTVQSGGNRDTTKFADHNVTYPFALQCSKLVVMGGDDCDIMGNPVDLNNDTNVRKEINTMNLRTMAQRLATKQFPQQNTLPNADGKFMYALLPEDEETSDDYLNIPPEQLAVLNVINLEAGKGGSSSVEQPSSAAASGAGASAGDGVGQRVRLNVHTQPTTQSSSQLPPQQILILQHTQTETQIDSQADVMMTQRGHTQFASALPNTTTTRSTRASKAATTAAASSSLSYGGGMLTETLVDETQVCTQVDGDGIDDDSLDPSGGFELRPLMQPSSSSSAHAAAATATTTGRRSTRLHPSSSSSQSQVVIGTSQLHMSQQQKQLLGPSTTQQSDAVMSSMSGSSAVMLSGASRATRASSTTTQSDGPPFSSGSSYSGVMSHFQLSQQQEENAKRLRQQKLQASQQCFLSGEEKRDDDLVLTGNGSRATGGEKEDHILTGSSETGSGFDPSTRRNGNGVQDEGEGDVRKNIRGAAATTTTTTHTSNATEKKQKGKGKSSSSSSSALAAADATMTAGAAESQYDRYPMNDDDADRYWVTQEFMSDDALSGLQHALATQSSPRIKPFASSSAPAASASSSSSSSSSIDLLTMKAIPLVPIKEEEPPPVDPTLLNRRIRKHFRGLGMYEGCVDHYNDGLYWILYDDGDTEEMDEMTLRRYLIALPPVVPVLEETREGSRDNRSPLKEKGDDNGRERGRDDDYWPVNDFLPMEGNATRAAAASGLVEKGRGKTTFSNMEEPGKGWEWEENEEDTYGMTSCVGDGTDDLSLVLRNCPVSVAVTLKEMQTKYLLARGKGRVTSTSHPTSSSSSSSSSSSMQRRGVGDGISGIQARAETGGGDDSQHQQQQQQPSGKEKRKATSSSSSSSSSNAKGSKKQRIQDDDHHGVAAVGGAGGGEEEEEEDNDWSYLHPDRYGEIDTSSTSPH